MWNTSCAVRIDPQHCADVAEERFVSSRSQEYLDDSERGRLIELIGEGWAGEYGTEPNAICRLVAELAAAKLTTDIVKAQTRIKNWVAHECEMAARRELVA